MSTQGHKPARDKITTKPDRQWRSTYPSELQPPDGICHYGLKSEIVYGGFFVGAGFGNILLNVFIVCSVFLRYHFKAGY